MKRATKLTHLARAAPDIGTPVNPPLVRASTILQADTESLRAADAGGVYGANGTHTHRTLEALAAALYEDAHGARAVPSGLAACAAAILAFAGAGDRILIADNVYGPTRQFATRTAARFGIETAFFDPLAEPAAVEKLMTERTRLIFLENPGSVTFEFCDLPAIAAVARARGVTVAVDDTWSAGVFCDPLALGADVAVQAATKYWAGHADAVIGVLIAKSKDAFERIDRFLRDFGLACGVDEAWLTLRGLRSLEARLKTHEANALTLAHELAERLGEARVLHPALPHHPGHDIWRRDFTGACGLVAFTTQAPWEDCLAFCDALTLFGKGYSWGGYESLVTPWRPERFRTATAWPKGRHVVRLNAGLEDASDLAADLDQAFAKAAL